MTIADDAPPDNPVPPPAQPSALSLLLKAAREAQAAKAAPVAASEQAHQASCRMPPSAAPTLFAPQGQEDLAPSGARAKANANLECLKVLRMLAAEGRDATQDELAVLGRWAGWGAVPMIFDEADLGWAAARDALKDELASGPWPKGAWEAARRTVLNAHYTAADIVQAMWTGVQNLGFTGGRILEPGCGSGNFIGLAPRDLGPHHFTGIELDPVTARIAKTLYPHADVRNEGFETTRRPDGWFDLAIGNVPFGKISLHDPTHNAARRTMHNHFIIKALRLVKVGGLVVMVTSRFTMDAKDYGARQDMAHLGQLLGAVRLPAGSMRAAAGTDVVMDVLFFRRSAVSDLAPWSYKPVPVATPDGPVEINSYFAEHPEMVLGTLGCRNGQYNAQDLTVRANGTPLPEALATAIGSFAPRVLPDPPPPAPAASSPVAPVLDIRSGPAAPKPATPRRAKAAGSGKAEPAPKAKGPSFEELRAWFDAQEKKPEPEPEPEPDPQDVALDPQLVASDPQELAPEPQPVAPDPQLVAKNLGPPAADEPKPKVPRARRPKPTPLPAMPVGRTPLHQEGSILRTADGFARIVYDMCETFEPTSKGAASELGDLLDLRDTILTLLQAQAASADDADFAHLQTQLNARYDNYVMRYGPLNRFTLAHSGKLDENGEAKMRKIRPRMGGFGLDPAFYTVLALEIFDPDTQTARKADIFSKRVVGPRESRTTASSPEDALAICLDERGRVDPDFIAKLLGVDVDEARSRLGQLVWTDPATDALVTAAEYLSGNVRDKLRVAVRAAANNPAYQANVDALAAVQPPPLGAAEIDARLGAPWIPASDVERFVHDVLFEPSRRAYAKVYIEHAKITATWEVSIERWLRSGIAMTSQWGTVRADAIYLLQASLNQKPAEVYDTVDTPDGEKKVLNVEATFAAREKQEALEARFREWIWEDPERAERTARVYNDLFNSTVLPTYDGSHLTTPGRSLSYHPKPHPHQLNAVWRILQSPATLLAHPVGAGKTDVIGMGALELRRLGLVNKPCAVVPNHMLDQIATELLQLYPQAKIMVPTKVDMTKGGRKHFVARCATGDWDLVLLTHSAFERIPVSPDTAARFLRDRVTSYQAAIRESSNKMTIKKLEAAKLRMEAKILTLLNSEAKDDGVSFEATGIDYVFYDEAQAAKNLPFPTKMRSVGGEGSQRAADLELKLTYLRSRQGDRVACFSTATPIANSVAEMFVVQSYLQPETLADAGVDNFDGWAATFGSTVTALELAPDGGSYRMHSRFARFHNVPELITMFRQVADVRTPEELKLPIPDVEGGKARMVIVPASDELVDYVKDLVARAEAVRNRRVHPKEDNMLKVCGDGRKAALDLRLVDRTPDPAGGKIAACANSVAQIWERNRDRVYLEPNGEVSDRTGSFQLVFCDLGTPKDYTWNVYAEMREALVARGIPESMIRFVHEATDARAKADLFAACRAGRVAVLLGSTGKMGVGTNVQTRLVALHHLDCPWRPDEIEQREGRALRQGNQNAAVTVARYATEASFDVYMWQTVERKARFIYQVMSGQVTSREIDDISEAALSYAEIKALATGNPLIMEKAGVDNDVARLIRLRRAHESDQRRLAGKLAHAKEQAPRLETRLALYNAAIERRVDTKGEDFAMRVGERDFDKRAEAGYELRDALLAVADKGATGAEHPVGHFAGFDMVASCSRTYAESRVTVKLLGSPINRDWSRYELRSADAMGLIAQFENPVRRLERTRDEIADDLFLLSEDVKAAQERFGLPFDQEASLVRLLKRQAEIDAEMKAMENKAA